MVKKKGPIWTFFNEKGKGVCCKYCLKEYKQSNAVKMERHIKKCFKCPSELKNIIMTGNKTETLKKGGSGLGLLRPLTVDTNTSEGVVLAGPSSANVPKQSPLSSAASSSTDSSTNLTSPSTLTAKKILPFWDQMDIQTNVSSLLSYLAFTMSLV